MFKIAILRRFIDIINKSWQLLQMKLKPVICEIPMVKWWQITHPFYALVLLISIPSKMSILS